MCWRRASARWMRWRARSAQSLANTSHHLRLLASSGLVRSRRDGAHGSCTAWRATGWPICGRRCAMWRPIMWPRYRCLPVSTWVIARASSSVSAAELAERVARGQVVVLDVRPRAGIRGWAYRRRGLGTARDAPLRTRRSSRDGGEVIAYCRGPYCVYADDAVRLLQARGVRARRLDVGFPEWRRAGLPVERRLRGA